MQRPRTTLDRLTDARLDVVAAVTGLVGSLALLPLGLLTSEILVHGVPASIGLGCLLYLVSTRTATEQWVPSGVAVVGRFGTPRVAARVVPRLVVVGLAGLVVLAVLAGGRPLPFLLLASGIGSLVLAQILFAQRVALDYRVVLAEVVALALVVRYAALLTTPGFVGIDNWTHVTSYAAAIQETGSLAALSGVKYYTAPFYHLLTVAAAEVLGVPLREALYLTVAAATTLSVVAVFATARYVVGVRGALLATMLFAVSDYVVNKGIEVTTTSLGLVFFLVVLLFLTRILYVQVERTDFVLLAAFAVAVALSHQVSAFITTILLGTAVTVVFLSRYVDGMDTPNEDRHLFGAFGGFVAFTTGQWAVTPWRGGTFFTEAVALARRWLVQYTGFLNLVDQEQTVVEGEATAGLLAELATYVDAFGLFVFLVVASLGSLTLLQRTRSAGTYTYVGSISVMLVCALALPLFGFRFLLPGRWFAFAYAPMAVVGAVGLGHFVRQFWTRGATVSLLVLVVVFPSAMLLAHDATMDQPTFDQQWTKFAHTEPELAAAETFDRTVPDDREPIYTDHPYFMTLTRLNEDPADRAVAVYDYSAYMFTATEDGRVAPDQGPVVYRTYQSEAHPTYLGPGGVLSTRQLSVEQVCPGTRNHVYTNGDVLMCTGP